jgi:hypothetical protein
MVAEIVLLSAMGNCCQPVIAENLYVVAAKMALLELVWLINDKKRD